MKIVFFWLAAEMRKFAESLIKYPSCIFPLSSSCMKLLHGALFYIIRELKNAMIKCSEWKKHEESISTLWKTLHHSPPHVKGMGRLKVCHEAPISFRFAKLMTKEHIEAKRENYANRWNSPHFVLFLDVRGALSLSDPSPLPMNSWRFEYSRRFFFRGLLEVIEILRINRLGAH